MKRKPLLLALLFLVLYAPAKSQETDTIVPWNLAREIFHQEFTYMKNYVTRDHLSSIYDIQAFTNSLLVKAVAEKEYGLIDSLAGILLNAATTLREVDHYPANSWKKIDSIPLGRSYRMWLFPRTVTHKGVPLKVREEYHLSSSQFLFLVAQTLRAGLEMPRGAYPWIDSLIAVYPQIILEHHYQRWITDTRSFQLSGWGCAKGTFTHRAFLSLKQHRKFRFKPTICPVVTDADLFIIAGLAQMMAAHTIDSVRVPIAPHQLVLYKQYLQEAELLLQSRIEMRPIATASGVVEGFAFDNGFYRDYKEHRYALYEGETFPAKDLKVKLSEDAAWDVSHARRFFFIFNALHQVQAEAGLSLDYQRYMNGLARQFYHVIYIDTVRHLFANYLNGDNGWYRVNYHGEGFGYPPYSMSQAALEGGWFFLGSNYPPVADLGLKLWQQFNTDPEFYNRYYGVVYKDYKPVYRKFTTAPSGSERFVLLQWLPSL
jgi:hypothetical protein